MNKYQEKINARQRIRRKQTNNLDTRKYEKTKNGFLMRAYHNMKSRINGIQKQKHHLYKNKCIWEKHEFYSWSLSNKDFHLLFRVWEDSNYNRKLTPSVDRIDSSIGYNIENCRWVTHSQNSANIRSKKLG